MAKIPISEIPRLLCGVLLALSVSSVQADAREYDVQVQVDFSKMDRQRACAPVKLVVRQEQALLLSLSWQNNSRLLDLQADDIGEADGRQVWQVPSQGGVLSYCVVLDNRRSADSGYDSRVTSDWVVFRGDDLVPPVRTRFAKGTRSNTRLTFRLPSGWSVITPYEGSAKHEFAIDHPERKFDRPTGWMTAGKLGVRRDTIDGTDVVVAGPRNQGFRRLEVLVLLGYTLDSLKRYFPDFPSRLTIIGAGEEMWMGALSGPDSLFIHADRPLISGNGTSTLLHELGHVGLAQKGKRGADWIVEGLAEFLSVEVLRRSGGITRQRHRRIMAELREWGGEADSLRVPVSSGPVTARAVIVFAQLHDALGDNGFRELVAGLARHDGDLDLALLRRLSTDIHGVVPDVLDDLE